MHGDQSLVILAITDRGLKCTMNQYSAKTHSAPYHGHTTTRKRHLVSVCFPIPDLLAKNMISATHRLTVAKLVKKNSAWTSKVHYSVHKNPKMDPILSWMTQTHAFMPNPL
jgi:hypothetical protein